MSPTLHSMGVLNTDGTPHRVLATSTEPVLGGKKFMKAPPFSYVRAPSLADAFKLWSDAGPDAKLLAGGQSLLATLAFRLSEPSALIDISRVPELAGIAQSGGVIRVGALTTHAELGASELIH
ncbi:MAG: hypothetical protein EHM89_19200, partial [Acidobacteria bacterium]